MNFITYFRTNFYLCFAAILTIFVLPHFEFLPIAWMFVAWIILGASLSINMIIRKYLELVSELSLATAQRDELQWRIEVLHSPLVKEIESIDETARLLRRQSDWEIVKNKVSSKMEHAKQIAFNSALKDMGWTEDEFNIASIKAHEEWMAKHIPGSYPLLVPKKWYQF